MTRNRRTLATLAVAVAATSYVAVFAPAGAASKTEADALRPECPTDLACEWIPAAYQQTDPDDSTAYGNYDLAERPSRIPIRYIVIHNTEAPYQGTVQAFQNPEVRLSSHYLVRSHDGHVVQMVPTKDVAWHAGNWYVNAQSIGIEQEGWAAEGATWFTPEMYRSTAGLVRHLAARYDIPLDRQHIIGHDVVPGTLPGSVRGMHWDPGPFWDWGHFFRLLGKPIEPTASPDSELVTIAPVFKDNAQRVRDCERGKDLPDQPSSFVPLRIRPMADSPLYADPGLHPDGSPGTDCAADWGSKASTGQTFVVAERRNGWTAIWWAGGKAWFRDPSSRPVTVPTKGWIVRPREGKSEVPVYGRAYPEASAYPQAIPAQDVVPLPYTIKAGQAYASAGPSPTGYYYAKTVNDSMVDDHTFVQGKDRYLNIQIGHRIGYVKAEDVDLVPAGRQRQ